MMQYQYLKDLKKGDFFLRTSKPVSEPKPSQVWVRGEYDRSLKAYECYKWEDINHVGYISGKTLVYTDIIF